MKTTTLARRTRMKKNEPVKHGAFILRTSLIFGCVTLFSILLCVSGMRAAAQVTPGTAVTSKKVPQPRTVEGIVRSKSGSPIQNAVVYLKDTHSLTVKSFLSTADGSFHFRQLSLNADYDLWAELNGKRSKTRSISQFNSKPDLHYTLTLDTGK